MIRTGKGKRRKASSDVDKGEIDEKLKGDGEEEKEKRSLTLMRGDVKSAPIML
jgi:hypothetical protein